jgi:hypothetical protein
MPWLVIIGVGIAGAVLAVVTTWRRGDHPKDLGAVSHQWIAEHRMGSGPDPRR